MAIIRCQSCYTRFCPPPNNTERYYSECPDCRDKAQHTATENTLLTDVISVAVDLLDNCASIAADAVDTFSGDGGDFSGGGASGSWDE